MTPRSVLLLAALALSVPTHAEVVTKVDKARDLINQANAQKLAGKYTEALASYTAAAKADPSASQALSYSAMLLFQASQTTDPKNVEQYRGEAQAYAKAALKVDQRDPNAMEVLRLLADGVEQQRREPLPAALPVLLEGEALFGQRKYAEAAVKYEQAIRLDPTYSDAVVYLGDCYYMQGDMAHAEQKFRLAAEMEPQYGPAWRYLYDALLKQDKKTEAQAAAFGALATVPSNLPNWLRVYEAMEQAGRPLTRFPWQPRASLTGTNIRLDPSQPDADSTIWLAYAMSMAAETSGKTKVSPYAHTLAAWKTTLKIISELGGADKIKDPGLRDMVRFDRGGQLQAAIFALHYKEAYRSEFEAWKKAEPDGLRRFVETFRVGL